ncbi:hypothetical protein DPMN_004750 [Dreissena polymorpha]|uniref:Uncharacterized protein n=1 Tax=Dreissena polymorpha TaxID=45954 RepID=A0A9D4RVY3_DREPO|nr:hypothetical protein DPMN_004750 [Dreissena polymorpha]
METAGTECKKKRCLETYLEYDPIFWMMAAQSHQSLKQGFAHHHHCSEFLINERVGSDYGHYSTAEKKKMQSWARFSENQSDAQQSK